MYKTQSFKRKLLAATVASYAMAGLSASAIAQGTNTEMVEEVLVSGIRASQESAVNLKRNAASVVEGISAEDIGKLPDVTISDSLQRISGIQIRRSAGEGGAVNIRGLPQVVTQLNGEQYLGANSVVATQPNFGDIPSQLFKGADVYKSAVANLGNTGITGTVNLRTYRPFDFDDGFTFAGGLETQYGTETEEVDPVVNGLFNWKNEKVGFMVAATYANVNLSNSYNGIQSPDPVTYDAGWTSQFTDTDVGLPDENRRFMGAQGFSAWNQVTERERVGINTSFQVDLGEGFTLITDYFYTNQDEYNRKVGLSAENKWQGWDWFTPTETRDTGAPHYDEDGVYVDDWSTFTKAELNGRRLKSFTQNDVFHTTSRNLNVQLDYDNGGAFTGSFRAIVGEAVREKRHGYNEGDMTDGSTTGINPLTWGGPGTNNAAPPGFFPAELCSPGDLVLGAEGGCFKSVNPLGYSENPQLTYDTTGKHPRWGGFDNPLAGGLGEGATIADYMANLDSYNVGAYSSENNEDADGDLKAFSLKGSYAFEDSPFVTSVDVGLRFASRSADFERYHLFSPFYSEGCEAQWKATDVQLGNMPCREGEQVSGVLNGFTITDQFVGYTVLPGTPLDANNNVLWVTDYGPVKGIPGSWAVDPKDYDDPEGFHNRVFGSTTKHIVPGNTFLVDMDELTYYVQGNFESGPVSGNLGVRVIDTALTVTQNIAGSVKPYGNTNLDVGDVVTTRTYTDVLPALNLAYSLNEDVTLRFAYSENMTPLDLNQYGDGLTLNTAIDSNIGSPTQGQFIVTNGNMAGNPELDPWRSKNFDLSAEWYFGPASMVSVGLFKVDVESFTERKEVLMPQPDADGVIRREVFINTLVQGEGGTLEGAEISTKLAFGDFTDGFISNFGIDTNYTYSPSEVDSLDVSGNKNLFNDNSEDQFNIAAWYQGERFQARIAYNYRSERLTRLAGVASGELNLYQADAAYVDISASYDVTDAVTVYVSGSNVTGEFEEYYAEFEDQLAFQNFYEPRYTLGVRGRF